MALSTYLAGLHVVNSSTWTVHPQPGNLTTVDAGFTTAIGTFSASYEVQNNESSTYVFQTPPGTTGTVILDIPGCNAKIDVQSQQSYRWGKPFSWSKSVQGWSGPCSGSWGYSGSKEIGTESVANGTVTISDVPGGNYTVSIRCT